MFGFDTLFHDPPVEQPDGAIGEFGVPRIVRDHADGGPGCVEFAQQAHHRLAVRGPSRHDSLHLDGSANCHRSD